MLESQDKSRAEIIYTDFVQQTVKLSDVEIRRTDLHVRKAFNERVIALSQEHAQRLHAALNIAPRGRREARSGTRLRRTRRERCRSSRVPRWRNFAHTAAGATASAVSGGRTACATMTVSRRALALRRASHGRRRCREYRERGESDRSERSVGLVFSPPRVPRCRRSSESCARLIVGHSGFLSGHQPAIRVIEEG
ncbi:DUF2968 domain-containing protein [Paraburkholderia sprentiae]|uniref:DUF2968 domain-containing protein n=1 Tax=Paraburkholderia sprentiae TaxID=948107 RepID=UPI001E2BDD6D|nr:DUF2968 domain-containing protein [Paraburkholderia sprentiae]